MLKTETKKNHLPSDRGPHLTFESLTKEVILIFDQASDEEDCYMERRKVLILIFEGCERDHRRIKGREGESRTDGKEKGDDDYMNDP